MTTDMRAILDKLTFQIADEDDHTRKSLPNDLPALLAIRAETVALADRAAEIINAIDAAIGGTDDELVCETPTSTGTIKPLTPEQMRARAERDAKRNARLAKMQSDYMAKQRDIRSKMGT